jgi:hypothetical protein
MILPHEEIMVYARVVAVAALLFFLLFTVPYFKRNSGNVASLQE